MLRTKSNLLATLCIILIGLIYQACAVNPVTGKKEIMLVSEAQELAMGQEADPGIIANFGLYQDEQIQSFINEKGKQMGAISHLPNLDYQFRVLDSPVVNAFAVPGGYVYFTRGIMAHFNNEAEFAGVLGHEIGHITARHSASQQSKQILAQIGLVAGLVLSPQFAQYAEQASQGLGLLFLKFGRDDESQSDMLGVEYSTAIGYDSHYMADFFQTLHRKTEAAGGQGIPTFLSTHPDPLDRYGQVHKLTDAKQAESNYKNFKVNRDPYLRMIDGLVYGEDPKQGFVENDVFYHPELKFEFPVPRNWRLVNAPTQVQMAPEDGKALQIFTIAAEKSLQEAANAIANAENMTVVSNRPSKVSTFPAQVMVTTQKNAQDGSIIKILTYLIKYNNMIYKFHGMSLQQDFSRYENSFRRTMEGFRQLKDQSKIDRLPERIRVRTVKQNGTFASAMQSFNMPKNRLEELAILNGMQKTDKVTKGMLLKTIGD